MSEVLNIKAEIYENNQDCINLTFENHWNGGKKEAFAMLMWPSHSIEQTEEVEKAYEATARFLANAKSELSAKDEKIKELKEAFEHGRKSYIEAHNKSVELEQKLAEANERLIQETKLLSGQIKSLEAENENQKYLLIGADKKLLAALKEIDSLKAENEKLNEENAELLAQKLQQLTKSTEIQSSGKGSNE